MRPASIAALVRAVATAGILCLTAPPAHARDTFRDAYNAAARHEWKTAAREFMQLAERGDARAQVYLANMYRLGLGVPRDMRKALQWTRLAAAQGNSHAEYNLGVHYRDGVGIPRNDKLADKWFEAAARQGLTAAQINLGIQIAHGEGTRADPVRGYAWLYKAEQAGDRRAADALQDIAGGLTASQIRQARALAGRL